MPSPLSRCILYLLLCTLSCSGLMAKPGAIQVIIPASKPSRPAHFNWQFTSGNGAPAQVGQFACGSYWVAPAAGDAGVIMLSLTGNPDNTGDARDLLSCSADPLPEKHGLLSGKNNYGSYDASENVLEKLPQRFQPAEDSCISLVAAMQRNEGATSHGGTKQIVGEVVDAYCVVTILPGAPVDGGKNMIRPNITGKKEFLTWDDFELKRLPRHSFLESKDKAEWQTATIRWRNSIEIFGGLGTKVPPKDQTDPPKFRNFSEGGRAFRSHLLVPNYSAGTAQVYYSDLLALFSDQTNYDEAKPAIAAMISYGLDLYHARYDSGDALEKSWFSGAGQWLGGFAPVVFSTALLKDEEKAHEVRKTVTGNLLPPSGGKAPQEFRQIKRGRTGVLLWGDGHPNYHETAFQEMTQDDWRYWADFYASHCWDSSGQDGNPAKGKKTAADQYGYIDGPANKPESSYMNVTIGGFRGFAAVMILMPEFRSVANSDAPIEYVDRLTRHGLWTWPDPVAAPTERDRTGGSFWWSAKGSQDWGSTWGPNPKDLRRALEDGQGRFKSLHGTRIDKGGYEAAQAKNNWDKIMALYDGEKYEDNLVGLDETVAPEIFFETGKEPRAHLVCASLDATIYFTTDGENPTIHSNTYKAPFSIKPGTTVKAFAVAEDKKPSRIKTGKIPDPL